MSIVEIKSSATTLVDVEDNSTESLSDKLNVLLANYSIFHQNVRGYHWNLRGANFFELHEKFEKLYERLYTKMDEIAERILTIGYQADHNFSTYISESLIDEKINVSDGIVASKDILSSLKVLITLQKDILYYADELGDEGTYHLMSDAIKEQEKLVWMYSAYLGK
jgi:starvation-inducible DNA-binding protein